MFPAPSWMWRSLDGSELVTSPALLDELGRVLAYPKLAEVIGDADEIVGLIAVASHVVDPTDRLDLARDPDDNRVLEAAVAGQADVIVTGDDDLLALGAVGDIRVLSAGGFLGSCARSGRRWS